MTSYGKWGVSRKVEKPDKGKQKKKIYYTLPYRVVLSIKRYNVYKQLTQKWFVIENEQQMSPPLIISNKDNYYTLERTFDSFMNNYIFSRKNVSKNLSITPLL